MQRFPKGSRVTSATDKTAEDEIFRLIANYTYDWESWIGCDGRPRWINPAVERLTGYTVAECLQMPDYPLGLVHPEDRNRMRDLFAEAMRGSTGNHVEFKIFHRSQEPTWGAVSWQPLHDRAGQPLGLRTSVRDITALKMHEARAQNMEMEFDRSITAERAVAHADRLATLGRLAGGLAHDFNNTLAAVKTFIELAQTKSTDTQALQYLDRALDAVRLGANVNRRLLAFARRDATTSVAATHEAISAIVSMIERALGADIVIQTAVQDDLWPSRIDGSELESALLNLAINARDAMPEGGTLSISARNEVLTPQDIPSELEGGAFQFVHIAVRDTGKGMTREVLQALDAPFFTTKGDRGTGLGLKSVREFARNARGFVSIESSESSGTTVHVYLPRFHGEALPAQKRNAKGVHLGDGETILLVEDDVRVLEALQALLEGLAYSVLTARSGAEALDLLRNGECVHCILSDIVMPGGMSGYELAAEARAHIPALPIVLASGHNDIVPPEALRHVPVLRKPYSRMALGDVLFAVLHPGHTD